jgi:hypothetical protein
MKPVYTPQGGGMLFSKYAPPWSGEALSFRRTNPISLQVPSWITTRHYEELKSSASRKGSQQLFLSSDTNREEIRCMLPDREVRDYLSLLEGMVWQSVATRELVQAMRFILFQFTSAEGALVCIADDNVAYLIATWDTEGSSLGTVIF